MTGTDLASIDTKRTFLDGDHAARNARLDAFHATQTFSDVNPTASVVPISVDAAHSQHRLLSWPKRNQRCAASSLSARSKLAGDYPELPWKPSRNESDGDSETSSPRAARCPLSEDDDFETVCLKTHINRKLELEEGRWNNEAEASLIKLIEAGRNDPSKNNTHLLWIRLTLAFAMRAHEKEALAMRLFTGLVEPASGKSKAKLESPHHLHVAEMALKLLREGRWEESRDLPQSHGLRWVRQETLDVLEQTDEISAISEDNRYEWGMRTGSVRPGR